jgi:predicted nucleic acid-binding protein
MIFADLLAGEHIFLDANTLIYHFGPHPSLGAACNQQAHGLTNLASHDGDFDRVPGITRYGPV